MAAVDPLFAQWLQDDSLTVVRVQAAIATRWGESAQTSERVTGIATKPAAQAAADRDLAFFSRGPFAIDQHLLRGDDWHREIGFVVTLESDQLGYAGGLDVFVLGAEVDRPTGLSTVTVLVPLSAAK